jgi:addiction module HigA family antidote
MSIPLSFNELTPPTAGSVLRNRVIKGLGISQAELARALGLSRPRLNMILSNRIPITPEIALRLSKVLGTPPHFWLQLRAEFELFEVGNRLRSELARLRSITSEGSPEPALQIAA